MKSLSLLSLAALTVLAMPAGYAAAGDVTDAAATVEAAMLANDFDAWQVANEAMLETLWAAPGLHFGTLTLTEGPAAGYGVYEPRATNVYAKGEPVLIYAEPKGYGYGDAGDGLNLIAFDIDLNVLDPEGTVLAEIPNIMALEFKARSRSREFLANLTYNLTDIPAGSYTLETVFHDRNGGQTASFTSEIVVE